jgi:hypothetical protein
MNHIQTDPLPYAWRFENSGLPQAIQDKLNEVSPFKAWEWWLRIRDQARTPLSQDTELTKGFEGIELG